MSFEPADTRDPLHSRTRAFRTVLPYVVICVVGIIAYGRVAWFDFGMYDDDVLVLERVTYLSKASNIVDAFGREYWYGTHAVGGTEYYRPLVTVTFIVDALISPGSPHVSHVTNLVLHLLSAMCVFVLFRRMLVNTHAAALFAVIFAAHPLASNAVGWIAGRNDSLLALFSILSFIGFLDYVRTGRIFALAGFTVTFAAALLTKESAVVLPLLLALWVIIERKDRAGTLWLPPALAAAGIGALWWIVRSHVVVTQRSDMNAIVLANLPAALQGVGKTMLPVNLSPVATIADTNFVFGIASIVVLGLLAWRTPGVRVYRLAFGLAWFVGFLLPSLMVGIAAGSPVLECRLYLPMLGVFLMIAELEPVRSFEWTGSARWITGGVLFVLIALSQWFVSPYATAHALWENAVQSAPSSPLAHINYGIILESEGRAYDAEQHYRESLRIDPTNGMAHVNIGDLMRARGSMDSAEAEYRAQLATTPTNAFAWYGLAGIALQRNNTALAIEYTRKSLQVNPFFPDGWVGLAQIYVAVNNRAGVMQCAAQLRKLGIAVPAHVLDYLNNASR